jgi:hypothetical protein
VSVDRVCWTWSPTSGAGSPSVSCALRLRQCWTELVLQIMQFVNGQSAVRILVQRWAGPWCVEDVHGRCQLACIGPSGGILSDKLQGVSDRDFDNDNQAHADNDFPEGQPPRHRPGMRRDNLWLVSALDAVEQGIMCPIRYLHTSKAIVANVACLGGLGGLLGHRCVTPLSSGPRDSAVAASVRPDAPHGRLQKRVIRQVFVRASGQVHPSGK